VCAGWRFVLKCSFKVHLCLRQGTTNNTSKPRAKPARTVAVVDVPVDDEDAAEAEDVHGVCGCDCDLNGWSGTRVCLCHITR